MVVFFVFGGDGDTTINLGAAIRLRTGSVAVGTNRGGAVVATTGTTTLLVPVAVFISGCAGRGGVFCVVGSGVISYYIRIINRMAIIGCIFLLVRGKALRGAVVVGTIKCAVGILLAVGTLGGGAAMIVSIGTLGIGAGNVSGALPPDRAGIARGSRGIGRSATG